MQGLVGLAPSLRDLSRGGRQHRSGVSTAGECSLYGGKDNKVDALDNFDTPETLDSPDTLGGPPESILTIQRCKKAGVCVEAILCVTLVTGSTTSSPKAPQHGPGSRAQSLGCTCELEYQE